MPGQSGPGSNDNEGVLRIIQSPSITWTSPSDCLVSYPGHSWWGGGLTPLQRSSRCILQPQPTGQHSLLGGGASHSLGNKPSSYPLLGWGCWCCLDTGRPSGTKQTKPEGSILECTYYNIAETCPLATMGWGDKFLLHFFFEIIEWNGI